MGRLMIVDDCLAPEQYIYLTYKGKDPWGVVEKIDDLIKPFFHISTTGFNNYRLNWDVASDPITFYTSWWIKKDFSAYSKMLVELKVQGEKSKTDNMGWFRVQINVNLETNFEGPRIILKPFWIMYSYLFYDRARRKYIEECRDYVLNFRNKIKEMYGMGTTKVPGGGGSYE